MSNRVAVLGVGVTQFSRDPEKRMDEMAREAALLALEDAGMNYGDIEAGFVSNVYQPGMAPLVFYNIAKTGIPITRVDIACASGTRCAELCAYMIEDGAYDTCLVIGVERMPKGIVPMPIDPEAMSMTHEMLYDAMMGLITLPGAYAYKAVRYMHDYGATPEQMAQVSVKNHRNACLNPTAMYQKEMSLEEVLNSRMISYPLTLFQCCANSSGATAAILCSERKARQYTSKPVFITGWREASVRFNAKDPVESTLSEGDTGRAAKTAYEKSGIGPGDVDFAQVHDAFSFAEILHLETLGLCPEGEGAVYTWEGNTEIDGKIPVNTDGGLLGCGHPLGASGGRMIAETYLQLKGEAGARQVKKHKTGVVQNSGLGGTNVMVLQV
jgi:acetyl-CoA acetyltransferase